MDERLLKAIERLKRCKFCLARINIIRKKVHCAVQFCKTCEKLLETACHSLMITYLAHVSQSYAVAPWAFQTWSAVCSSSLHLHCHCHFLSSLFPWQLEVTPSSLQLQIKVTVTLSGNLNRISQLPLCISFLCYFCYLYASLEVQDNWSTKIPWTLLAWYMYYWNRMQDSKYRCTCINGLNPGLIS